MPNVSSNHRNRIILYPDTRRGLGYGTSVPSGRSEPRISQSSYPYGDPDPYEDVLDDIDDIGDDEFITKMLGNYSGHDPLPVVDPFYYVGGNTKLSEALGVGSGMSPFPNMYNKRAAAVGGFSTEPAYKTGSSRRTGSKRGYFSPPPEAASVEADRHDVIVDRLKDILSDDELAVLRARLSIANVQEIK